MFDTAPAEWREANFSSLADYANGKAFKPEDWGTSGLPIIRIAQITNPRAETHFYSGPVDARHLIEEGNLIFSWSATLAVMRWSGGPAVLNQHLFKVTPAPGVDLGWLQYRLEASIPDLAEEAHGTTMKHIRKGTLTTQTTRVPCLDEQRRIAEVLRSVDNAIAANDAVIATAKETVAMLATTIAKSPGEPLCIADFGRVVTGRTPPPSRAELWGGDIPFITPGDLSDGVISINDASRHLQGAAPHGGKLLPGGSVLVTCIGSTIGKTTIAKRQCATNQQINAVCCPPEISGYVYLACVALYDELLANAGRQAIPIINKSTFALLPVARRKREEMVELSAVVDALDKQMQLARASLDLLKMVKRQLAGGLLSGSVRVPA